MSTRKEIGRFVAGSTIFAWSQKSFAKAANSGGDVAWISRSEIRRSRARSARPRWASLVRAGCLPVRFAFTAVTLPGRYDSSIDFAAGLDPIGVHHGQHDALSLAQGNHTVLPVVAAGICPLQSGTIEDLGGEFEVEPALTKIPTALASIPAEAHSQSIRLYIQAWQICQAG